MDILGGIASLGSAALNYFGASNAQDKAIAAQNAINEQNWRNSVTMAQNSVQWRVADAEKAGVNPLYALGAPTMSFAPAQVGAAGVPFNKAAPLAGALRDMGQDVSRSALAGQSPDAKVASVVQAQGVASNNLDLERKELTNAVLRARLASLTQPATPPGGNFVVSENPKPEQRPPLMFFGSRWPTNPNTSPMKAWEDQYGDEGPVASTLPIAILANDLAYRAGGWNAAAAKAMQRWGHPYAQVGRWYYGAWQKYNQ